MWIFESPTNYSEMVSKISKSVFIISLIILYLFCQISEDFNLFLEQISFGAVYELGGIKLNFALLVVPLLMGILEHVFKIHDKISSLLKIRIRYDKRIIISTMLKKCGNNKKVAKLSVKEIKKCMNIFYEYASSTSPKIDTHYITLTLNEWCWFWIFFDILILILPTSIIFLILKWSCKNLLYVGIFVFVLVVMLFLIMLQTISYTKKELDVIFKEYRGDVQKGIKDALHSK